MSVSLDGVDLPGSTHLAHGVQEGAVCWSLRGYISCSQIVETGNDTQMMTILLLDAGGFSRLLVFLYISTSYHCVF